MDAEQLVNEARALVTALRYELRNAIELEWMKAPRLLDVLRNAEKRLSRRQELARVERDRDERIAKAAQRIEDLRDDLYREVGLW